MTFEDAGDPDLPQIIEVTELHIYYHMEERQQKRVGRMAIMDAMVDEYGCHVWKYLDWISVGLTCSAFVLKSAFDDGSSYFSGSGRCHLVQQDSPIYIICLYLCGSLIAR